jgi:hypothetical protein
MSTAPQKDHYGQSSEAPDWAAAAAGAWEAPSWKAAAREYREALEHAGGKPPQPPDPQLLALLDPKVSLEQAQRRLLERRRGGATASTVEALMFSLRSRGVGALGGSDTQRRLSELNAAQLREVALRLRKLKPKIARAWSPKEVEVLIAAKRRLNNA